VARRLISLSMTCLLQVGVYGYTAYSMSKFALRGMGEALQHEVTRDNIRVSLIFPPDTETPGFEEGKCGPCVF
jgi:NAD(P)-dependent dehydrogenase (short-subunit alcohol dehydrogenase family)